MNHSRPSCASMMDRQIASPIPIPSDLVVKSGANIRSRSCALIPEPVSATDTVTRSPSGRLDSDRQDSRLVLRRHRVDGIHDQVEKHLLQLDAISPDCRQPLVPRLRLDGDAVLLQVILAQGERFLDELVEIEVSPVRASLSVSWHECCR